MLERMGADAVCMSTRRRRRRASLGIPRSPSPASPTGATRKSPARLAHGDVTAAVATAAIR